MEEKEEERCSNQARRRLININRGDSFVRRTCWTSTRSAWSGEGPSWRLIPVVCAGCRSRCPRSAVHRPSNATIPRGRWTMAAAVVDRRLLFYRPGIPRRHHRCKCFMRIAVAMRRQMTIKGKMSKIFCMDVDSILISLFFGGLWWWWWWCLRGLANLRLNREMETEWWVAEDIVCKVYLWVATLLRCECSDVEPNVRHFATLWRYSYSVCTKGWVVLFNVILRIIECYYMGRSSVVSL